MSGWVETDSEDNSLATASHAPLTGKQHVVYAIHASFSATISGKLVQLKDGSTVIWEEHVHDHLEAVFPRGIVITLGGAVSAELAASGAGGTIGKINIHGDTF